VIKDRQIKVRGFHPSNSLPLWQQAPKRELLLIVVLVLVIITLTTSIVFFLFIIINRHERAKVLPMVRNGIWRIKRF
jgi:flagellar basal body-associated protein FliL